VLAARIVAARADAASTVAAIAAGAETRPTGGPR
jgi:hypothetical protein